ncbi:MAG: glutamine synthetase type III, partial [Eubacteriales bacterium]
NEAPPAIVSMFIGSDLEEILTAIENDTGYDTKQKEVMRIGVHTLPKFSRDTTDRNRTSPFAFTGNKFEFRMLGSAASISCANTVLNTTVAEELKQFADTLEGAKDFEKALHDLIKKTIVEHKRIIFNGDGYDEAWVKEAEKRGLYNLKTTPDALAHLLDKKNTDLFISHGVYSMVELEARHEVLLENYCKTIGIEALTMIDMARKDILPAMSRYSGLLADTIKQKREAMPEVDTSYENETLKRISSLLATAYRAVRQLEEDTLTSKSITDTAELADYYKSTIREDMTALRIPVDEMEMIASAKDWPYPSYGEMLFSVR